MNLTLKQKIRSYAGEILDEVIGFRRHFHQNPELSFDEEQTANFISDLLDEWSVDYKSNINGYGIIAFLKGELEGEKVVAFRADMDALPIQESNNVSYCSRNNGVMHACGHDVHMANLLGVIKILQKMKCHFSGTAIFIFQPAEERFPGGAKGMLQDEFFIDLKPDCCFGLHVYPEMNAGEVGFKPGPHMASVDEIYITVKGKGGHAALPHKAIDSVLIAAEIIIGCQHIISRRIPADIPSVLSFGKVVANGSCNILPDEVFLEGTLRTMNEDIRGMAKDELVKTARSIARGLGGELDIEINNGYPVLINNESTTNKAIEYAKYFLGSENVKELGVRMTAEDFAYYAEIFPSCFFRLGVKKDNAEELSLHSSNFDVDEKCLLTGLSFSTYLMIKNLNG